jgi:hypothetical protein
MRGELTFSHSAALSQHLPEGKNANHEEMESTNNEHLGFYRPDGSLIVEYNTQERSVHVKSVAVPDEPQLLEFVHE